MNYIGIDNGIAGAIAFLNGSDRKLEAVAMPIIKVKVAKGNKNEYDIPAIIRLLKDKTDCFAILEKAQAYPGQGSVSMFSIGRTYGIMEGILAAMNIPYIVVHPKTWQKKMFEGMHHEDTKQASIITAQRLFPDFQFIATDRSTKLHNGMTDAALMAYYGYIVHGGQNTD